MDQTHLRVTESDEMAPPRRVLRKGTHSCAECKRRKARCFFEHPAAATCVACQRRGTPCISQEFVDVPASKYEDDARTAERLERIERMLERLTERVFSDGFENPNDASHHEARLCVPSAEQREPGKSSDSGVVKAKETPCISPVEATIYVREASAYPAEAAAGSGQHVSTLFSDTCRTLHSALPCQRDVDILFEAGRATIYLQALCNSYRELFEQGNSVPRKVLSAIPPENAHPVLLARKLLQLCLCIQQLDPSFDRGSLQLGLDLGEAMHHYFSLASSMVTCHDELLNSLEGLECLICEGVYLVNCGNLRRALVCLRRASTLAQFMGMHRRGSRAALKQHDPATRVSGDVTWAHIAYLERYLSLLLGLPTSIANAKFGSDEKTAGETDAEWFERVQIDICELIINTRQRGDDSFATTREIDDLLNQVTTRVPSTWWTPMDLSPNMSADEVMSRVISGQMQIVHYNMLTVLHLPYLLRQDPNSRYDYNKTVCTYASREVLTRYISFRSVVRVVYCCRLVDFCAFTATLTLLIAHLSGHGRNSSWLSAHQRVGDRNLVEKTIATLEELNRLNHDELSRETAKLARTLLDLEAESAKNGNTYLCSVLDERSGADGKQLNLPFCLKIPYFGTVGLSPNAAAPVDRTFTSSTSLFPNVLGDVSGQTTASSQMVDPPQRPGAAEEAPVFPIHDSTMIQLNAEMNILDFAMPDLIAEADEWAFQGVDAAFFDSLMAGYPIEQYSWNG